MNYAFKMMAVVLALGVMVIGNPKLTFSNQLLNVSDYTICKKSVYGGYNNPSLYIEEAMKSYVLEAIRRNLKCEANLFDTKAYKYRTKIVDVLSIAKDNIICELHDFGKHIQNEAKRRGLDCGVKGDTNNLIVTKDNKSKSAISLSKKNDLKTIEFFIESNVFHSILQKADKEKVLKYTFHLSENPFVELKNINWNTISTRNENSDGEGISARSEYSEKQQIKKINIIEETVIKIVDKTANEIDLFFSNNISKKFNYIHFGLKLNDEIVISRMKCKKTCIVNKNIRNQYFKGINNIRNKTVIASKPDSKPSISSAQLEVERKMRLELERELAEIKNKKKQEQQRIKTDNQEPTINAFTKQNGSNATISGRVTDNTEVAEVLIDGEQLTLTNNGTFKTELYIPRSGLNVEIVAYDRKGNKASKLLKIERGSIAQASGPVFDTLNPSGKSVASNPNALALIIGVADYEKTNADALYADKDAQQFYDYATMKLGIKSSHIKELVNDKADLGEILINVKDWLRRSAKPNKSDIYIYFAGHGLASDDGTKMYLLPYDGRPRLLENTAVL